MPPPSAFVPRVPFTLAEEFVDFALLDDLILRRRLRVERAGGAPLRRLVALLLELGPPPAALALAELADRLARELSTAVRVGAREARREITEQRKATEAVSAYVVPDAGRYARVAALGVASVLALVRERAELAARAVGEAASEAATENRDEDFATRLLAVNAAATRVLHNHVLELVGEALNMGRAAGALSLSQPPEFAMRSEQLDKATCDQCSRLHGEIVQVGSTEFYELMPPAHCFGGGRCRGMYVFGDEPASVEQRRAA